MIAQEFRVETRPFRQQQGQGRRQATTDDDYLGIQHSGDGRA